MNSSQFGMFFYNVVKDLETTLGDKAHDYATEDVLANFKRLSAIAKVLGIEIDTDIGYAVFMILMKLDRICNLLFRKRSVRNEPLAESFRDLIGYTILAWAIYEEREHVKEAS
jgi:hypothetical protein